jgi:organic hydroperoxide reductase OsmC/OhrA
MDEETRFTISFEHMQDRKLTIQFGWTEGPDVALDDSASPESQREPHATLLLAVALGNCFAMSLASCLRELQVEPHGIETTVRGRLVRRDRESAQINQLDVQMRLGVSDDLASRLERCLKLDDEYRMIRESVRAGIPIHVHVLGASGSQMPDEDFTNDSGIRPMYN